MIDQYGELISTLLHNAGCTMPLGFRHGCILVTETIEFDAADKALQYFCNFGGNGWLCTAESAEILSFNKESSSLTDQWPRWGELVTGDRKKSLSLRHTGSCWTITLLEDAPASAKEGLILPVQYLGRKCPLTYDVFYDLNTVNGVDQYTAICSRFTGFAAGGTQ